MHPHQQPRGSWQALLALRRLLFDGRYPRSWGRGDRLVGQAWVGQPQNRMASPLTPRQRMAFPASGPVHPLLVGQVDKSCLAHGSSPGWGDDSL